MSILFCLQSGLALLLSPPPLSLSPFILTLGDSGRRSEKGLLVMSHGTHRK